MEVIFTKHEGDGNFPGHPNRLTKTVIIRGTAIPASVVEA
jgi:hypothetical protein